MCLWWCGFIIVCMFIYQDSGWLIFKVLNCRCTDPHYWSSNLDCHAASWCLNSEHVNKAKRQMWEFSSDTLKQCVMKVTVCFRTHLLHQVYYCIAHLIWVISSFIQVIEWGGTFHTAEQNKINIQIQVSQNPKTDIC